MNPLDSMRQSPLLPPDELPTAADPETAAAVRDFLATTKAELQPTPDAAPDTTPANPDADEVERVNIPPRQEFNQPNQEDQLAALLKMEMDLPITQAEKEDFIVAALSETAWKTTVSLYNNKFNVVIRDRSNYETQRVYDVVQLDEEDGLLRKGDVAGMYSRMQYYMAALMIERVNEKLFSDLTLKPFSTITLKDDAEKLREAASRLFYQMSNARWSSLLSALRIFESKRGRLLSMGYNSDFWNPQG